MDPCGGGDDDTVTSFTNAVECGLLEWAPDGIYLAHCVGNELLIRNARDGLSVLKAFRNPLDQVDKLEWSSDSVFVAAGSYQSGIIRIYNCEDFTWTCCIDMGNEMDCVGLQYFCWNLNPKNLQIIATACEYIQMTIWSIMDNDVKYIKNILPVPENKSFRFDGRLLAVAQYNWQSKVFISIYDTNTWKLKKSFRCDVNDLKGVKWCPDGSCLLVWDSILFSHLYIFSPSGELLKHYSPDGLSLGINDIDWCPNGQILAFTNHSNKIRFLNSLTYGLLMEFCFKDDVLLNFPSCQVFEETVSETVRTRVRKYSISTMETPTAGKPKKSKLRSEDLENYFTKLKFSSDGNYLAVWTREFQKMLWIWDLSNVTLISILIQRQNISDFVWSPEGTKLSLCTGLDCVYIWTPEGPAVQTIPDEDDFKVHSISWNQYGNSLALCTGDRFLVCHLQN